MAEIPSLVFTLSSVLEMGIGHITLGMNDLTSLVMGTVRGSPLHRMDHPAVLTLVRHALASSAKYGAECSAAGYLNADLLTTFSGLGLASAVLHYSQLPLIWPSKYRDLAGIVDLMQVKRHVREKLNEPLS